MDFSQNLDENENIEFEWEKNEMNVENLTQIEKQKI